MTGPHLSFPTVQILNLDIHNITLETFLQEVESGIVFTPNIDHLIKLQRLEPFFRAYQQAHIHLCDSRIIQLLSKLGPIPDIVAHLPGSDVFPAFCRYHGAHTDRIRIFLLGGKDQQVSLEAQKRINEEVGAPIIVGAYSPPMGFHQDEAENQLIYEMIQASGATVLAVGLGAPKQEYWIVEHQSYLPDIQLFFAIGKTIDFLGGATKRAPRWMTRFGLEWAYRLFQEPRRLARRYLKEGLPFFILLWRQWRGAYQNPFETTPSSPKSMR